MTKTTWSTRLPCGCVACRVCRGSGRIARPGEPITLCPRCRGTLHSTSWRVRRLPSSLVALGLGPWVAAKPGSLVIRVFTTQQAALAFVDRATTTENGDNR